MSDRMARYMAELELELRRGTITRRQLLKLSALAGMGFVAACAPVAPTSAPAAEAPAEEEAAAPETGMGEGEVIVVSFGGTYQDAQREAIFRPFEEETGITVRDTSQPSDSRVKAMVDSGNVEWDVITTGLNSLLTLGADYFQPIDYSIYPQAQLEGLYDDAKHEYAVGTIFFAEVNTYRTDVFPTGEHPKSWTEWWDAEAFPGPRTLPAVNNIPSGSFEAALMADGVPPDEIYPIDIERAFASLENIRDHVVTWWDAGAVPGQLLTDQEIVLAMAYNGRMAALAEEGVPVAIEWNQGVLFQDRWFIVANSPNPENAQRFVQYATSAEAQGRLSSTIAYGPTNANAFEHIPEDMAVQLPSNPDYASQMVFFDDEWWGENQVAISEQFAEWRLG